MPEYIFTRNGDKDKDIVTWSEYLKITGSNICYHTYIASPFFKEGYKHELHGAIEKEGIWKIGMMGMTFREDVPIAETLNCLAFARAYRKVYEREVPNEFAPINLSIEEFLNMIDEETDIVLAGLKEKHGITSIMLASDIVPMLIKEGFSPQDPGA